MRSALSITSTPDLQIFHGSQVSSVYMSLLEPASEFLKPFMSERSQPHAPRRTFYHSEIMDWSFRSLINEVYLQSRKCRFRSVLCSTSFARCLRNWKTDTVRIHLQLEDSLLWTESSTVVEDSISLSQLWLASPLVAELLTLNQSFNVLLLLFHLRNGLDNCINSYLFF